MISIITADIVNSTNVSTSLWMKELKKILNKLGKTPKVWEIFRGDSFQCEIKNVEDTLHYAFKIKMYLKAVKDLDVRMAIGIGEKGFNAKKITESNGEAFTLSGRAFDKINDNIQTVVVSTKNKHFDSEINLILRLYLALANNWTEGNIALLKILIDKPNTKQAELAKKLKISQPSVSSRFAGSYFKEFLAVNNAFINKLKLLQ